MAATAGSSEAKRPYPAMVAGPLVLAALTIAIGLFPEGLGVAISDGVEQQVKLVLWPGFKPALALSAGSVQLLAGDDEPSPPLPRWPISWPGR